MLSMICAFTMVYCMLLIFVGVIIFHARKSDILLRAYGLDISASLITWVPWALSFYLFGFLGLVGSFVAQFFFLSTFSFVHARLHNYKGPTIKSALNKIVGVFRNHIGLVISLFALPVFWIVRLGEIIIYPLLMWTLGFPKYKQDEWINISRHKFEGLVGHDLIWCLYCDWMTGIYSLGGEMLRNVESFWCPIRFYDGKKCENCKTDFPDIEKWIPMDGTISDVTALLKEKYPIKSKEPRGWFGHPDRKI
ncbi:MAG: hypothetical protein HYZ79_02905 [Candidatus Melainabacteria bacterium]|nr:hypothetical protein [Candidatus Melainabacteria bacterium]